MAVWTRGEDGGLRLYIGRWRVHHGLVGCGLVALGAVLAYHDRRDRWWRLVDEGVIIEGRVPYRRYG